MTDPDSDLLPGLWRKLPEQAGMILGSEVSLGPRTVEETFEPPSAYYSAVLEGGDGLAAWVVFEAGVAVTAGGVLVMRPHDVIKERIGDGTLEDDDLDAMGEFVNQMMAPLNDSLKDMALESAPHFVFSRGTTGPDALPDGNVVAVGSTIDIAGVHEGRFWFVLPAALMRGEEAGSEAPGDPMETGGGVDLSPEELAAIREATQDAAAASVGRTLFVVPLAREREAWTEFLDEAGIDYEFAADHAAMRRALGTGTFGAVVVDADACASGGLPYLAIVRDDTTRVPAVVVASAPTRTHLVSCVAAGASAYLAKPLEPDQLVASVDNVRRY